MPSLSSRIDEIKSHCIFGKNAARDVYPKIIARLGQTNRPIPSRTPGGKGAVRLTAQIRRMRSNRH